MRATRIFSLLKLPISLFFVPRVTSSHCCCENTFLRELGDWLGTINIYYQKFPKNARFRLLVGSLCRHVRHGKKPNFRNSDELGIEISSIIRHAKRNAIVEIPSFILFSMYVLVQLRRMSQTCLVNSKHARRSSALKVVFARYTRCATVACESFEPHL